MMEQSGLLLDIDGIKPLKSIITPSLQLSCLKKNILFGFARYGKRRHHDSQSLCSLPGSLPQ